MYSMHDRIPTKVMRSGSRDVLSVGK